MRSFRLKIIFSFLALLVLFLSVMVPLIRHSVDHLVADSMSERSRELVGELQTASDEEKLLSILKDRSYFVFFHTALLNQERETLYDSQVKRFANAEVIQKAPSGTDIDQAEIYGSGMGDGYSALLGQRLSYISEKFEFQGKSYILRMAFPYEYTKDLKHKFTIGLIVFSALVLVLFALLTGLVIYQLMGPVRQMIRAIRPYHQGKSSNIAEIKLNTYLPDEFSDLATTFNSLSARIEAQIATLTLERNEKSAILEALAEGVIAITKEQKIAYANQMAHTFLQLDSTAIGKKFHHPSLQAIVQRAYEEKCAVTGEIQLGSYHLNIIAAPMQNEESIIIVLQDQSIHYKILEMRKEFIANASHELKTPITIIRGYAETLQDNPSIDSSLMGSITQKIVNNCQRMTKIVQNLLTLADIEQLPHFRLQSCHVETLLTTSAQTVLAKYPDAKMHFSIEKELFVHADPELLDVALSNLIDNAAKYSKNNAEITLKATKQANRICLEIQDNGIGIPENDIPHLFERFYTVNKAESKKKGGSGLGLSIVETIIEKHQGRIRVESELGIGSTFTIELPEYVGTL